MWWNGESIVGSYRFVIAVWVTMAFIMSAPACYAVQIGDVVASFDSGVQQSSSAIRKFYVDLNDFERTLYFNKLLFSTKEMLLTKDGHDTALVAKFSDQDIQARVLALNVIGAYSRGLVKLASPGRAKTTEKSITNIAISIQRINNDFGALTGGAGNSAISQYAGPIGALAGLATKYWMGAQREKALRATILEGAPQIDSLLNALDKDLKQVMESTYKNGIVDDRGEFISYYNNHLANAQTIDATKVVFLNAAKESADRYARITEANPAPMIKKMRKVHEDLVKWAQQKNAKPESIDGLLDDLDAYLNDVDKLTQAVSSFR